MRNSLYIYQVRIGRIDPRLTRVCRWLFRTFLFTGSLILSVNMQNEIWKPAAGLETRYEASNLGRIRSIPLIIYDKRNRPLVVKGKVLSYGNTRNYKSISLRIGVGTKKTFLVHRVIAATFVPNPENKPEIDHIDGNPHNNRADNLRWVTHKENQNMPILKQRMGNAKRGDKCYFYGKRNLEVVNARPIMQMDLQGNVIKVFPSATEAHRQTGILTTTITNVAAGGYVISKGRKYPAKTAGGFKWKYITREEYAEYAKNV